MEEQNKNTNDLVQNSFYVDETLIKRAGGNQQLMDRLVGLSIAEVRLAEDPENPSLKRTYDIMKLEVKSIENEQNQ